MAVYRLERDAGEKDDHEGSAGRFDGLKLAATDPKLWMLTVILYGLYICGTLVYVFFFATAFMMRPVC